MSREGDFWVYCTELYKSAEKMTGRCLRYLPVTMYGITSFPVLKRCIPQAQTIL